MDIVTKNIDHLGLVSGMCDEIGISDIIDRACGDQAKNKNLTFGKSVKCMILNGLGFVGRTLYLYSEYFEDKPIAHLLDAEVTPEQIDNNVLGRTLDKLFELGVTELFSQIALKAMKVLKIEVKSVHLDSTSFHVDGEYNSLIEQDESRIKLTRGYSRDHRPELNQAILQMITSNQGNLPLFMQAASGNTSDKTAFSEIISEHLKSFQAAVGNRYFVGDSALFTPASIQALDNSNSLFVTRVPSLIIEGKKLISKTNCENMSELSSGYKGYEYEVEYAGVLQRWAIIFSTAAYKRDCKSLNRNYLKGSNKELQDFRKLSKEVFSCPEDALKHYNKISSKYKYIQIDNLEIVSIKKRSAVGRPKKDATYLTAGYQIKGAAFCCLEKKKEIEKNKGFFILSTNDLSTERFSIQDILETYKSQQSVERGFRFLKSPDFLVSALYLKKPERIEALLMIMTLCLLVYAAIEHKVRDQLSQNEKFFPNQLKKPSQNPTSRWIFFCFLGLHMVVLKGKKHQITNLKPRHNIILDCLGPIYRKLYYSELW